LRVVLVDAGGLPGEVELIDRDRVFDGDPAGAGIVTD